MQDENTSRLEVTNLEFEQLSSELWSEGRNTRGLGPDDPYEGDACANLAHRMLDAGNDLSVMFTRGMIDEQTEYRARILLHDMFTMTQTASG